MKNDEYTKILGYTRSIFQEIESYLKTEVDSVEDNIRLVLDEYNSTFITYEITPGIYAFKDISEVLFNIIQPKYRKKKSIWKLMLLTGLLLMSFNNLFYKVSFEINLLDTKYFANMKQYTTKIK